ncbi:MAG: histidine triad nucleotide-binding protein [Hamadaea sp.]|uniref:histidine triad nucleotide-binding protein n=1 Tax=Hamadaea sp. TaxID=2024425 RepID=UPI0017FEE8BD|nr:histidine triad nucleotide-binding protein [Hamadaea sp.]NUR70671.1 histidine triad nucleotide-binding protein [Hamadaea sp.]NUT17858.1 histidine triad nucleotide-binding protein [Hamadaea sp.]
MTDCLFCRIVAGEIPATVVYETDAVLAFRDIRPKAGVHVLVIPKQHFDSVVELGADPAAAGALIAAVGEVARAEGVVEPGFRTIFNTGPDSGMEVPHVHAHILGGGPLGAMVAG